ncbi:NPCBM/NEW2 domain-containing protein [Micromonospora rhizosphaerae]|uniref:NPCBM/NEW2 domain-containing protein n=1 Tax=Micromonospora rhizosphaerae TaxID=568872 RepID=A0A1C6SA34_9ACTN|nr:NPCBM/NEW2 domain-containing protein [Micromonospora rhizosphaerae]SCL26329.1 NPCBM/NEW2 domain-containing protein [Micromonospora rhizosphaerae]
MRLFRGGPVLLAAGATGLLLVLPAAAWQMHEATAAGSARSAAETEASTGPTSYWLSDLDWVSATGAWGPVERDMSNGENATGDGNPISLDGKVYQKGLGLVPNSKVAYDLNGRCGRFRAVVGVDDEVDHRGNGGSVVFQVVADGTQVFDSGVRYGVQWSPTVLSTTTGSLEVDLDVTGVQTLELVTTPWLDGFSNDHADWADARVACVERP